MTDVERRPRVVFDAHTAPSKSERKRSGLAMPPGPPFNQSTDIQHLGYHCPGLTGPGSRCQIERRTYRAHFGYAYQIVIPIFQRQYCWPETQLRRWWRDASGQGAMQDLGCNGTHDTGKSMFKLLGGGGRATLGSAPGSAAVNVLSAEAAAGFFRSLFSAVRDAHEMRMRYA